MESFLNSDLGLVTFSAICSFLAFMAIYGLTKYYLRCSLLSSYIIKYLPTKQYLKLYPITITLNKNQYKIK